MSVGFLYCLKRERDISVKTILGGVKTAFRCIPALILTKTQIILSNMKSYENDKKVCFIWSTQIQG